MFVFKCCLLFTLINRYGKPGCDAETCDYFLSYRRIGTDVEYEMSADTDGWVAVGFSSDKKMVCNSVSWYLDQVKHKNTFFIIIMKHYICVLSWILNPQFEPSISKVSASAKFCPDLQNI